MTLDFLAPYLLWTKSFHLIAVIAWMAGLFYLPRLFVYHCEVARGSVESERFKVMERRLLKQIMNPAMIVTWTLGILLILTPGAMDWSAGWWHVKLLGVILMSGFHGAMSKWRRNFMEDRNVKPQRFYRYANEIPTVLMVVIVIMAVAQPSF
jgi:putative membrane protein